MSDPTPFHRSQKALLIVLVLLFAGSLTYAIKAEKPWGKTVAKRVEKHQELQPKEYAVIGLWWGAVVNAGVIVVLLGTAKRWMPEGESPEARGQRSEARGLVSDGKMRRVAWPAWVVLMGILVFAGWLRAPRLDHSLWNDEEYAMRKFAHGGSELGKDGTWAFVPVTWTDTLFENRNGNNHVLNSLITREALAVWRAVTHGPRDAFSETALRMPAFIAGLLTLVVIFLLGRRVCATQESSGDLGGLSAAALLMLCPWHIRYAVEAKGYSFMLLFVCMAVYGLIRAVEGNRMRWWLLFALSEAAFLLSFAGSIYVAAALNVVVAAGFLKDRQWRRLGTLIAFNLLAMIPVLQWMLPSVPQLLHYLHSEGSLHLGLGWPWLRDFFSGLAIGFQFDNPAPAEHAGTSWLMASAAHGWIEPFLIIAGVLALIGIGLAFFQNGAARLAIVAPSAAVVAAYAHNAIAGTPMVVWYLLYVIVPVSLAAPLAVVKLVGMIQEFVLKKKRKGQPLPVDENGNRVIPPPWPVIAPLLMVLFLAAYGTAISGPVQYLRHQPRQPMREAVAFARAQDAHAVTAVLGVSDRQIQSYDPAVTVLDDRKELASVVESARRESKGLWVYVCGRDAIQLGADGKLRAKQSALDALEHGFKAEETGGTPATFVETARFPGTEAMFSYRVYRMK